MKAYTPQLKKMDNKVYVFDQVRKKYIVFTKEETVRQAVIYHLHEELGYPLSRIAVERGIKYNQRSKRFDIVVFDNRGEPYILVECKAFDVPLKDNVLFQLATYNKSINAQILVVTNGVDQLIYSLKDENGKLLQIKTIPRM